MPDPASASPKPIPGTPGRGGEPSYRKPKLPPKDAILAYYGAVAPLLLRHGAGRPLNLFRCTGGFWFLGDMIALEPPSPIG